MNCILSISTNTPLRGQYIEIETINNVTPIDQNPQPFHVKAFLFHRRSGTGSMLIGSSNFTDLYLRSPEKQLTVTINKCKGLTSYDAFWVKRCRKTKEVYVINEKPGDVLSIEELSAYLKIPKSTLYKLVREGNIPCQKIGQHWRFRKAALDHWLKYPRANKPRSGQNQ